MKIYRHLLKKPVEPRKSGPREPPVPRPLSQEAGMPKHQMETLPPLSQPHQPKIHNQPEPEKRQLSLLKLHLVQKEGKSDDRAGIQMNEVEAVAEDEH